MDAIQAWRRVNTSACLLWLAIFAESFIYPAWGLISLSNKGWMALTINLWTKTMPACTEQVLHTRISVSYDRCRAFCTINITWMSEKKTNEPHQGSFMHWTTSRTQMTSVSGQIGSRQDKFDVFKILIQHLCLKRIIFKSLCWVWVSQKLSITVDYLTNKTEEIHLFLVFCSNEKV